MVTERACASRLGLSNISFLFFFCFFRECTLITRALGWRQHRRRGGSPAGGGRTLLDGAGAET